MAKPVARWPCALLFLNVSIEEEGNRRSFRMFWLHCLRLLFVQWKCIKLWITRIDYVGLLWFCDKKYHTELGGDEKTSEREEVKQAANHRIELKCMCAGKADNNDDDDDNYNDKLFVKTGVQWTIGPLSSLRNIHRTTSNNHRTLCTCMNHFITNAIAIAIVIV